MTKNVEHDLHKQTRAAASFLNGIREALGQDDELLTDMLEGETELLPALQKAANAIDEENILIDGVSKRIDELSSRKAQAKARVERIRALVEQAILIAGEGRTYRLPNMTITLKNTPQAALVNDEALIPSGYWIPQKPPAPKLDKKKLTQDMLEGKDVPGCELNNGGVSLQIRRK